MEKILPILTYLVIMNIVGIFVMYSDKQRAKKKKYRIPEKTLFLVSILGGSVGTWTGMYMFRHKIRHWYFVIGMPLILGIHITVIVMLKIKGLL